MSASPAPPRAAKARAARGRTGSTRSARARRRWAGRALKEKLLPPLAPGWPPLQLALFPPRLVAARTVHTMPAPVCCTARQPTFCVPGCACAAQVMEELIAKSKMYKAIKAQQKEEDFTETERLDAALSDLMAGGLKGLMRAKGVKR